MTSAIGKKHIMQFCIKKKNYVFNKHIEGIKIQNDLQLKK